MQVVIVHQKETRVELDVYQVNLVLQQEVVAMEQQVETHQHQQLVVWVEQEQILVQTLEQEVVSVEFLPVVVAVELVDHLELVVQEELVVEEMQPLEHNQEEMLLVILVVAVEEHWVHLLQHKVVMVALV
jgi:hypothetical protein